MEKYKKFADSLVDVCKNKFKLKYKKLYDFRFYHVIINENDYDKTVVFSSGIHGDEIAPVYAILDFLENYKPQKTRIVLFPCVNPYGFNNEQRYNIFHQDINRRFCDKLLIGEAKAVSAIIKSTKPDYFVSLHEWNGSQGYYMYASNTDQKDIISKIPDIAINNGIKLFAGKRINGEILENGIIWHPEEGYKDARSKCTLENWVYENGTHYICTETPSKANFDKRVKTQVEIINFILDKLI